MNNKLFTEESPGVLVPITQPRRDWAFIPHKLPPSAWELPHELTELRVQAREALGTLNGIAQTLPNPQLLLQPLQSREALTSSKIEGTQVTPEQYHQLEMGLSTPDSDERLRDEWLEVRRYGRALAEGMDALQKLPLCNQVIRRIHKTLMDGARETGGRPGEFRRIQVHVGSSGRYIPPPPLEIERLMGELEQFINQDSPLDPLIRSFLVHYQFEAIHPFQDGNGRVGRVLLALTIQNWLGHSMPWLYLSAYFERYKDEYIQNMFRISTQGDWTAWVEFCLNAVLEQANDSIRRCHAFGHLRKQFLQRLEGDKPNPRASVIADSLLENPVVTAQFVQKKCGVTAPTAKSDLQRLVDAKILTPLENTRPKMYAAFEVMRIAYGDLNEPQASDEN